MMVFGLTVGIGTAILGLVNTRFNAEQNGWWLSQPERAAD